MEICYAPHVVARFRPGHYIYTRRSANQCAPPRAKNGGRGGSGGARSGRPFGRLKQAPPTAAARSKTGEGGDGGGGGREEPTATATKQVGRREPAERPARRRLPPKTAKQGHRGGAAEPRRGRAGFCAPTAQPPALSGGKRAEKAQSRRMDCPPFSAGRTARIPRSADAIGGSTTSGNGGQRPHGGREQHASQLRGELPSRRAKRWPYL